MREGIQLDHGFQTGTYCDCDVCSQVCDYHYGLEDACNLERYMHFTLSADLLSKLLPLVDEKAQQVIMNELDERKYDVSPLPASTHDDKDPLCTRKGCKLPYSKHATGFYGRRFCPAYEASGQDKLFKLAKVVSPLPEIASDLIASHLVKRMFDECGHTKANDFINRVRSGEHDVPSPWATPSPVPLGEPGQTFEEWWTKRGLKSLCESTALEAWNAAIATKAVSITLELDWAKGIVEHMFKHFYPEIKTPNVLPDVLGLLTQISNMVIGLQRKAVPIGEGELRRPSPRFIDDDASRDEVLVDRAGWVKYASKLESELSRLRSQEGPQ